VNSHSCSEDNYKQVACSSNTEGLTFSDPQRLLLQKVFKWDLAAKI